MNQLSQPRQQMAQPGQQLAPIDAIRRQLDQMGEQFQVALPQHIPVDRFKRIVLTAVNQNPDLFGADRKSLLGACMKAAQDGLYPDGREGALVIFNTKVNGQFVKAVQWMPMVYGIIKKMRNSGELASIVAHPVYEKDTFKYRLGDDESIEHEPYMDGDAGKMRAVYAIAKLKDGTIQREVMTRAEVDKVRNVSKSKDNANGPWANWYEEMARKTVVRRLSKYLPMSTEIEDMLRRDDAEAARVESMTVTSESLADGPVIEHVPAEQLAPADEPKHTRQPAKPKAAATAPEPEPEPQPEPEYEAERNGDENDNDGEPANLFPEE